MLYRSEGELEEICCPLCRKTTRVPDGEMAGLGTNHALRYLIEELGY